MSDKIIKLEEFKAVRERLKRENKKIILCHGVYDLVHYGHIEHLKEAKSLGDILVVSITASRFVNKGPGRPYFNDEQRLNFMSSLEMVDYVILSEEVTVKSVVRVVKPDLYVKGKEYEISENDITANIDDEILEVRKNGGDVYFTDGQVFSSTKLINNFFDGLSKNVLEVSKQLSQKYNIDLVKEYVDSFSNMKILVLGDIIIDQYIFCDVQGLMSKDRALSTKYKTEELYPGGALAIARHLANFSDSVTVCGIIGNEANIHTHMLNELSGKVYLDLCFEPSIKTVVKSRFLQRHSVREQYDKLFSINYLPTYEELNKMDRTILYNKLNSTIEQYDAVIVCDYGHGLIDEKVMEIVQKKAKFIALNCQTNSSNYGNNLITKYNRAESFVVDERELRLAYSAPHEDLIVLLKKLKNHLHSKQGWVTVGADGAIGIDENDNIVKIPALTLTVSDTIGAGDAFYSLASLSAVKEVPVEIGTLLGNVAGAMKVHSIGNSKAIDKVSLLKFVSTVLNV